MNSQVRFEAERDRCLKLKESILTAPLDEPLHNEICEILSSLELVFMHIKQINERINDLSNAFGQHINQQNH